MPRPDDNRRSSGSVLVVVLIVLSSMTALSVGLAYRTRIELKLAESHAKRGQAYSLALGGIERSKALLGAGEMSAETIAALCAFGASADDEALFEQVPDFSAMEGRSLAYCVRDECGYFNVNRSDPAGWENLGILTREHLAGLLDWTDPDNDTGPGGAESDFYLRLPRPYTSKNAPCLALRELLFVMGASRRFYLGRALHHGASPPDNMGNGGYGPGVNDDTELPEPGLLDVFTVYGNGRLNINTAPPALLAALPGLDEAAVAAILTWRAGPDGQPATDDDGIAASAEDLSNVEGLTELQAGVLAESCCFESQHFRVFSRARVDPGFACCLMAAIQSSDGGPQIVHVEQLL